jgi:hypothetical protein
MDIGPSEIVAPPSADIGAVERIEPKRGMQGFGDKGQGARRQMGSGQDEEPSDAALSVTVDLSQEYLSSHEATQSAGSKSHPVGAPPANLDLEA